MKFYKTRWFLALAAVVATVLFVKYVLPKINMTATTTAPTQTPATTTTTATPATGTTAKTLSGPVQYSYN